MVDPLVAHFQPVALAHASRLINHGPTVLVTSAHAGRRNVMAAAWSMPVEFTPPRIAVVIDKQTFTGGISWSAVRRAEKTKPLISSTKSGAYGAS